MQHHMQCRQKGCYACKTDEMHVVMVTTQDTLASIEEAERCASPVDCWLMTPLPQEVVMGNLHDVAETSTVATAGVAAACAICAAVVAAAAAAAVKMLLQYVGMNAYCCMLKVMVHLTGGYTVSYVYRGESVQKTTEDRHSQHLLLVWSTQ